MSRISNNHLTDQRKLHEEEKNPCIKEHRLSLKCLDDNAYDSEKCELYFQNYRNCKEFWNKLVKERRRAGITPDLPRLEDRERIKAEYMSSKPSS